MKETPQIQKTPQEIDEEQRLRKLRTQVIWVTVAILVIAVAQSLRYGIEHPSINQRIRYNRSLFSYYTRALLVPKKSHSTREAVERKLPQSFLSLAPARYRPIIEREAERHDLDGELVFAVIFTESNFRDRAVSHKGAQGLMQLMPQTARLMGVRDLSDPAQNIRGGCRYLRQMLDQFDGDIELALAAYNAGPGAVMKHKGIPPYRETREYVRRVMMTYQTLRS